MAPPRRLPVGRARKALRRPWPAVRAGPPALGLAGRRAAAGLAGASEERPPHLAASLWPLCEGREPLERAWRAAGPRLADGGAAAAEGLALLVGAAAAEEDAALARRICLRLLATEEHVPAAVWSALVCAHARGGDADAAFALLGRLEARGDDGPVVPALVFEELIEGLVRNRRLQSAFDTFQRMRTWSLMEPSARVYAVMIRACGLSKDPERAVALFEELCAREEPAPEARVELIIALAGRRRSARQAFQELSKALRAGAELTPRLCGAVAAACGEGGFAAEAKLLRRRMMAAGVEQDAAVRASLVRAFGLAAAQLAPAGGAPGAASEREAARGRLLAHVWSVVQEARQEGSVPVALLDAVVHAYCDAGLPAHAEELLGMGAELGCEPSAESFSRVLRALEGEPRRFFALWERMLADTGARPEAPAMQLALGVAAASGDARRAQAVLEQMFAAREVPSAEAAGALRSLPPGPEVGAVRRLLAELGVGSGRGADP